jgi:Flp pilus assembly pilin Flp
MVEVTINTESRRGGEVGQALVEYALVLGLVSLVCVAGLTALGNNVNGVLQFVADTIG